MLGKATALAIASLLALGLAGPAAATEAPTGDGGPLGVTKLPHHPAFTPATGEAAVCQSYAYGDWHYKIYFVYSTQAKAWLARRYRAKRLRLDDGTAVSGSSAKAAGICPKGSAYPETLVPATSFPARYCGGCDHRPPPPAWSQVAHSFPPPSRHEHARNRNTASIAFGKPGRYWFVEAEYSWIATPDAPKGKWSLTGFLIKPTNVNSASAPARKQH